MTSNHTPPGGIRDTLGTPSTEEVEAARLPEILVSERTLYQGVILPNQSNLGVFVAEEDTVGKGVYLTSSQEIARGYASLRSRSIEGVPVLRQVAITNLRIVDLSTQGAIDRAIAGFLPVLEQALGELELNGLQRGSLSKTIADIEGNFHGGHLKQITFPHGRRFSDWLSQLGFSGLVTHEGGEGDIGAHDTWVVFSPDDVTLQEEIPLTVS